MSKDDQNATNPCFRVSLNHVKHFSNISTYINNWFLGITIFNLCVIGAFKYVLIAFGRDAIIGVFVNLEVVISIVSYI